MARGNELVYALNAGGVDKEALSRIDLEKMRISGEGPVPNWLPKVLGPMSIRPGFGHLDQLPGNNATRQIKMARSTSVKFVLLLSANEMRVSNEGTVIQVPTVSAAIATDGWTDESSGAATATGGATLSLTATATNPAKLRQSVAITANEVDLDHVLRIVVSAGPVILRIGTTAGGQELVGDTPLAKGTHKLGFVPGVTTIYVEIRGDDDALRTVSQIDFEAQLITTPGDLVLPTPWSFDQVNKLRTWQSIDVMYLGDGEQRQQQIEYRGLLTGSDTAWSVVDYVPRNGPFEAAGANFTMTPGAFQGNTTMTANENYFVDGHVGALIELTQTGKTLSQTLDGEDQATDYITVTGISGERLFSRIAVENSFTGTLSLQRSVEPEDPTVWADYATYVDSDASFNTIEDDGQSNLTAHYRFAIKAGEYTSGSVTVTLTYDNQVVIGNAEITSITSPTVAQIEVKSPFGSLDATRQWREGTWSNLKGWPRVPIIHDDRLHWFDSAGRDYASRVDDFTEWDDNLTGDDAPFTRSVSGGALEGVVWALSDERLLVGTPGFEAVIQANEFDGALTRTDWTARKPSRRGCADIEAVSHHAGVFYSQRSGRRIYELSIPNSDTRYRSQNISRLNPNACAAGIVSMDIQLQPETRLYVVLSDGSMVVLTYERDDDVVAFTVINIPGGLIEDVCVLPDIDQDDVYVVVNRNGTRQHLVMAAESLQEATDTCTLLDYHKVLTGSVSQITGATHLASTTVQVWADGQRRADVALDASGNGTLDGTYARVVYGLNYDAEFTSVKPAYFAQLGTAVGQEKIIRKIGLVLANSCLDGLMIGFRIGDGPVNAHGLPSIIKGAERTPNQFYGQLDLEPMTVEAGFATDTRFYVKHSSQEGPCTVQAVSIDVDTPENYTPQRGRQ